MATYRLIDSVAVREGGPDWLDQVAVIAPGRPRVRVYPEDGERFLRALPAAFTGTRLRAEFIA